MVMAACAGLPGCSERAETAGNANALAGNAEHDKADTLVVEDSVVLRADAPSVPPAVNEARRSRADDVTGAATPGAPASLEWDDGGQWRVTTDWRIGKVDGDVNQAFGMLTNVTLGPQGEVLLLDFQDQSISVFTGNGTFRRRIGRSGQGPGEFDGPLSMAWDWLNRLWVADGWNFRYSVFDSEGRPIKEIPRPFRSATGWRQSMILRRDGTMVDEFALTRNGKSFVAFAVLDTTGAVRDTLHVLPRASSVDITVSPEWLLRAGQALKSLRRFQPRMIYTLMPDGSVWFARTDEYRLHHRAANGDTLLLIDASHRNLALTRAEQNMIEAEMAKTGLEPSTFQLGRQILQAIRLLHDGHVLVQIEEEPGQPGRLFDVFDPTGRLRGSIRLNHDLDPSVRWADRGDTIIAVTFGELAVQYVVRLTIHRNKR
ncbi:MAG: hypothetical protein ACREL7_04170 [Longimicrobiales bacterium]